MTKTLHQEATEMLRAVYQRLSLKEQAQARNLVNHQLLKTGEAPLPETIVEMTVEQVGYLGIACVFIEQHRSKNSKGNHTEDNQQ